MGLLQALFGGQQEQQPQTLVQSILASRQQPQATPQVSPQAPQLQVFSPDVINSLSQNLQPTMQDIGNAAISRFVNKNPTITAEQMAGTRVAQPLEMLKSLSDINRNNALANFNGSGGAINAAAMKIMQENPGMDYTTAFSIAKSGLGQGVTSQNGQVTPMPGAAATAGTMAKGKELGTQTAKIETAAPLKNQERIGETTPTPTEQNTDTANYRNSNANLDRLANAAQELRDHPGLSHITGMFGAFPNVPGGVGADATAKLGNLKSQTAFNVLQTLRDSSKTGGALGQVSNYEEQLLQDNIAALDRAQSLPEYQAQLNKIIQYTNDAKGRLTQAFQGKYNGIPDISQPSIQQQDSGKRIAIITPDGKPGTIDAAHVDDLLKAGGKLQ